MSSSRSCKSLSIKKKKEIILAVKNGGKKIQVAKDYKIAPSTLTSILKKSAVYSELPTSSKRKRQKKAEHPKLEEVLLTWFSQCRQSNVPLSGVLLKEKAKFFAKKLGVTNFMASNGWLENFKRRNNINFRKICGESASVNLDVCADWKEKLQNLIEKYEPRNIFNADEIGLFYKCLPDRTMTFKGKNCHGGKMSKDRVTLLLACNMDGSEKLKPLMIGKSLKPRCFHSIKTLPLTYRANKKAWMTRSLFSEWLRSLNKRMQERNRKILLFIDNCQPHNVEEDLDHVRIYFLPANTTSTLQPLDKGIIKNFKTLYRKEVVLQLLDNIEAGKVLNISLFDSMNIVHKAWHNIKKTTIKNCFHACGFFQNVNNLIQCDELLNIAEWNRVPQSEAVHVSFYDYAHFDNNLPVTGLLNDEDILEIEGTNEDDTDEITKVTAQVAKAAVENLRAFFAMANVEESIFTDILKLDNMIDQVRQKKFVQTDITKYF